MSTDKDKPADPFGAAAADLFTSAASDHFAVPADPFAQTGAADPFSNDPRAEYWDEVSSEADQKDSPEESAKHVLNEVQSAFRERAQAEEKRYLEAVDSEFWIAMIFQTRAQKDEFLSKCGVDVGLHGNKYLDGPTFAKTIGRPVTPVEVRYNISDKLDRRLEGMTRGFDELSGLGPAPT